MGYGIIISTGPDEYIAAGNDIDITFETIQNDSIAGLSMVEEGNFVNNQWIATRRLNGDEVQLRYDLAVCTKEKQSGEGLRFPTNQFSIQRVKLYKYQ